MIETARLRFSASAVATAIIPIKILPSTSGAMGEAQIRTMRMRKAASSRVYWEADL